MILRGRKPRARPVFVRAAADLKNLHFCWQTEVREIIGTDGGVAAVELHDRDGGGSETLAIKAIFPFIGLAPRSGLVAAARDQSGGLVTDETLATDQPGLYAAGAVRAGHGGQIAHAIAEGKSAAQAVWRAGL
jgi:thioredoxin reductase (NADPH)